MFTSEAHTYILTASWAPFGRSKQSLFSPPLPSHPNRPKLITAKWAPPVSFHGMIISSSSKRCPILPWHSVTSLPAPGLLSLLHHTRKSRATTPLARRLIACLPASPHPCFSFSLLLTFLPLGRLSSPSFLPLLRSPIPMASNLFLLLFFLVVSYAPFLAFSSEPLNPEGTCPCLTFLGTEDGCG